MRFRSRWQAGGFTGDATKDKPRNEKWYYEPRPVFKHVLCEECKKPGGTLYAIGKDEDNKQRYVHKHSTRSIAKIRSAKLGV